MMGALNLALLVFSAPVLVVCVVGYGLVIGDGQWTAASQAFSMMVLEVFVAVALANLVNSFVDSRLINLIVGVPTLFVGMLGLLVMSGPITLVASVARSIGGLVATISTRQVQGSSTNRYLRLALRVCEVMFPSTSATIGDVLERAATEPSRAAVSRLLVTGLYGALAQLAVRSTWRNCVALRNVTAQTTDRTLVLATTTGEAVAVAGRDLAIQAIFFRSTLNLRNTPDLSELYGKVYTLRESGYRNFCWVHETILLPATSDTTGLRRALWARRTLLELHARDQLDLLRAHIAL